jgi:hypothetical protein
MDTNKLSIVQLIIYDKNLTWFGGVICSQIFVSKIKRNEPQETKTNFPS